MKILIFIIILRIHLNCNAKILTYQMARDAVLEAEQQLATGGTLLLSPKEKSVNKILMNYKKAEIKKGFEDPRSYAPSLHFFRGKHLIEQSHVFKFIKRMPKGALLHGHNTAMVSSEWVIKNLTYFPGLQRCIDQKGRMIFVFDQSPFHVHLTSCTVVAEERSRTENPDSYDRELEKLINLYTSNPENEYLHIGRVWPKFEEMFTTFEGIIEYLPALKAYHWRLLEELYEDGVIYVEFRTSFGRAYDNSGRIYSGADIAKVFKDLIDKFKKTHSNFLGAKAIYSTARILDHWTLEKKVETFTNIQRRFPDFVIGFDLVGQEDLGKPLYEILPILKTLPYETKFFFHAGETNWYGESTDENVLDALLLNTTRIGHGYSILKHPVLWNAIKRRRIPIEINPISNQVLHLVLDLRNHPAAFYMSEDIPIVISNDDPGFWNSKGVSYDYYYAFMCFTSSKSGLRSLKKLVWDSIKYSTLTQFETRQAAVILQKMWEQFLDSILIANN